MGFTRATEDRPTPAAVYNYRPYLLAFLSCLGSWMFGYNNGVIAGVLVLPSFYNDFHLPTVGSEAYNNTTSNIVSLFQIGGLLGSILIFPVMKYWGRKVGMVIWAAVYFLGAALQVCPLYWMGLLGSRLTTNGVTDFLLWKTRYDVYRSSRCWVRHRRNCCRGATCERYTNIVPSFYLCILNCFE